MNNMRVLHIISSLNPAAGGVSQAVLTMITGLAATGVQSEVATIDAPDAAYLKGLPFPVHACGPGKTAWQYAPPLFYWLQQQMANYDAVVVHALWQYQTTAAWQAWQKLKGKKPRLLVMPHGMLDPYFQRAKGRKIKALRNWLFWKLTEKNLVNGADAVLFTCETEKILAREPFAPYHPKKEAVVGLGVETPPPYREAMTRAFEQKLGTTLPAYWLFISRIHEKKGVDLLIRAYLQLKKEQPNLPPLVVAGPGLETDFGKQMQALAAGDKNIYFPGMLTGDAKWGAFYGSEIFILPSHQENFGIAVVEALACGKPVLISDQVNIWREIEQGGAGLISKDTLPHVQEQLRTWVTKTGAARQQIQQATIPCFEAYFSVPQANQQLLTVLK